MIDVNFDFRTDSFGHDPDVSSATLRKYQSILYSKELPNGDVLCIDEKLCGKVGSKTFTFGNDCIIHSYSKWKRTQYFIKDVDKSIINELNSIDYTIGGEIIFPSNNINGKYTINQARGTHPFICDRFDITLECIKRYYDKKDSPLYDFLQRYNDFFDLFKDFSGYVNFFYLNDLVDDDGNIKFWLPFNDFYCYPFPKSVDEYYIYAKNVKYFVTARNKRINKIA